MKWINRTLDQTDDVTVEDVSMEADSLLCR